MADIPCIYEMSMISEKDMLKEDILKGKSLDILLTLLVGPKDLREIAKILKQPSFSIQLYLKRLIEANLVKVTESNVLDGKVEKTYGLASTDVEIFNCIKENSEGSDSIDDIELSAQHFAALTRNIIRKINDYGNKPHKIKAYFIKADEEAILKFKKELEELFEKYQAYENLDADDTYGFLSVLAPYDVK